MAGIHYLLCMFISQLSCFVGCACWGFNSLTAMGSHECPLFSKLHWSLIISCRKPPRYVLYKCTYVPYNGAFGASDQGQTLDVWGWHPADVNAEVAVTPDVTTSLQKDTLNTTRYLCRNQCRSIRSYGLDPRIDPVQWLLCTLTPV